MRAALAHTVSALIAAGALAACDREAATFELGAVTPLPSPAAPGSAQAHLAVTAAGDAVLSWLEPADGGHALKYSVLDGTDWGAPQTIARGENWFINWADFPSVVPIDASTWIAHWLVLEPEQRYAYDIVYVISTDGGLHWSEPRVLNEDETPAEHGFVSFFAWSGEIGAIWLDGRRVAALSIDELLASEEPVGMTLRYARIGTDGAVRAHGELDELVCDCCQTDAAATSAGPTIVYRDRTAEERRDIVLRRFEGDALSLPLEIGYDGWIIDGCPVNGPALASQDGSVAVAWFTAALDRPRVRFARSGDGGRSFAPAVDVAETGAFGQVDVVLLEDGTAVVSFWQRAAEGGMNLVTRAIDPAGGRGEIRTIAHSADPLPIDVPQMQRIGNALIFAWSQLDAAAGIRTVAAPAR